MAILGVIRNKTDTFIRYRKSFNSYSRHRPKYQNKGKTNYELQDLSGKDGGGLLRDIEKENMADHVNISLPPEWLLNVDDITHHMETIKKRLKELNELHKAHLLPGFDDDMDKEQKIEVLTSGTTALFMDVNKKIHSFAKGIFLNDPERNVCDNIRQSFAQKLNTLSRDFRQMQKNYLGQLHGRKNITNNMFGSSIPASSNDYDQGFSSSQMGALKTNEDLISQREHEIKGVLKSITELSTIVRDLSTFVVDQGVLLDRIDYNLEQTESTTGEAHMELRKASQHQRKTRSKKCILLLCVLIACMIIVVIVRGAT